MTSLHEADDSGRRRVPFIPLARVLARSLLIQVGFNPRAMQGLGFTFALYPALRALYREGEPLNAAVRRHLGLFNTHPYFAAAILGGAVRYEERIASGLAEPGEVTAFRDALAAPLAAIGDAFFWNALRPACALLAAFTAPALGLWAIAVFLGLYNLVHLSVRVWLFVIGYIHAEHLVGDVGRAQFPIATRLLRKTTAVLAGAVAVELALIAFRSAPPGHGLVAFALVGVSALAAVTLAERVNLFLLLYGALAVALAAGALS